MTDFQTLIATIGAERVNDDEALCRLYSEDIAGPAASTVAAVIRPADVKMLSAIVSWANHSNFSVIARGGGMSYTGGYLPVNDTSIVLDMTELNKVVDINTARSRVTVEAGCNWSDLYDALKLAGCRTPFFGPLSGKLATVGGAVSQNSAFFGSARYGTVGDHIKGIELVDGSGQCRWFGEDSTGHVHTVSVHTEDWLDLLTGDAGAFGIKTRLVFATVEYPHDSRFASYVFDDASQVIKAMCALRELSQLAEVYAFDEQTHKHLAQSGFSVLEAPALAKDLLRQSQSLVEAAGAVIKGAALSKVQLKDHAWSLHVVADLQKEEAASSVMETCDQTCAGYGGQRIPDTIPRVTRARPFRSIKALVGPEGERWLPCHGVFSATCADQAMQKLDAWLAKQKPLMQRNDIKVTRLLARVGQDVIIEPQFFWPDDLSEFQRAYAMPEQVQRYHDSVSRIGARELVQQLRAELRDLFAAEGAKFLQIGKYYPLSHKFGSISASRIQQAKSELDPNGILNPGALER